jgi:hypothetical protein
MAQVPPAAATRAVVPAATVAPTSTPDLIPMNQPTATPIPVVPAPAPPPPAADTVRILTRMLTTRRI